MGSKDLGYVFASLEGLCCWRESEPSRPPSILESKDLSLGGRGLIHGCGSAGLMVAEDAADDG